jgi:hypothetical protein
MKQIKLFLFLYLIILSCSISFAQDSPAPADKGVLKFSEKNAAGAETSKGAYVLKHINTLDTFDKMKKNDIVAFLVGNNDYSANSGFPKLNQCVNDVRLLSKVLNICCKVPEQNIIIATNLNAEEFRVLFQSTLTNLKKQQALLLF